MKRIALICGGHSSGRSGLVRAISKVMVEHGIPFPVIKERLSDMADSPGFHILLERMNSQKELPDLDEPKNWLSPEPPKQKKFRSYQPDKRALNRKNRKRK